MQPPTSPYASPYQPGAALTSQIPSDIAPNDPNISGGFGYGNPAVGFAGGVPPTLNQSGPLQDFINTYMAGVVGPEMAGSNMQMAGLEGQLGMAGAQYQYGSQLAQQDYANSMAQAGIQQGDLSFLQQLYPQEYALQKQRFGLQGQSLGIQGQGLAAQTAEVQRQAGIQQRNLRSEATAGGAVNTLGTQQKWGDIGASLAYQLGGIGRSKQELGLQQQGLGLSEKEAALSYTQKQHQLSDMSKQLGITETEIQQRLQNSLNQLGIQETVTTDQLLQAMGQVAAGEYTPLAGLIGDIYQMTGLQVPTGTGK